MQPATTKHSSAQPQAARGNRQRSCTRAKRVRAARARAWRRMVAAATRRMRAGCPPAMHKCSGVHAADACVCAQLTSYMRLRAPAPVYPSVRVRARARCGPARGSN